MNLRNLHETLRVTGGGLCNRSVFRSLLPKILQESFHNFFGKASRIKAWIFESLVLGRLKTFYQKAKILSHHIRNYLCEEEW